MSTTQGLQPGVLNQSGANNFYASGIAASQLNGTGSQVQTNKLNRRGQGGPNVVVVPGPVQVIDQPVEVIKKVKKQVATSSAPVVQTNPLDANLRNLIAETQAKVALLVMENNRIKWRIAQKDAEIARIRGTSSTGVIRPSGTYTTPSVVTTGNVVRTGVPVSGPITTLPATSYSTTVPAGTVVTRSSNTYGGRTVVNGPSTVSTGYTPAGGQRVVSSGTTLPAGTSTATFGGAKPVTTTIPASTNGAVIRR